MNEFSLKSKNFIGACLSSFLYFGSFYLLLPTLPQFVMEELGGTTSQIGLVVGVFTVSSILLRPYFGKQSDIYGRKKMMMLGAALFSGLFAIYGLIQQIPSFYLLRIFHGIAHGIYLAAAFAYIADLAPPERRGEVMGIYGVNNAIAMAIFPAIGTWIIAESHNFERLFFYSSLTVLAGFFAICFVDEIKPKKNQPLVNIWEVARQKAVLVSSLTYFSAATVYGTVISFLPVYALGLGITNFGLFFTVFALFTIISRLAAGTLSDRYGRRKIILPFFALFIFATFLLIFLDTLTMLIFIAGCFGLGFGAVMPALNAFVVDKTLPHERASALAFFTSFMDVGISFGAVVLGFLGEYYGYSLMYGASGVIACLGLMFFAAGSKSKQQKQTLYL